MLLAICISLVPPGKLSADTRIQKVRLLFTSDIHGWLSTSLIYPNRPRNGLLHIAQAIKREREQNSDAILIDCGDLLQGSPLIHYAHRFSDKSVNNSPFFKTFSSLKYDAVVVGNHDLAVNPLFENNYLPNSNFKWLGANINRNGTPLVHPYMILHQGELKIAIIGLTTPGVGMWLSAAQLKGIKIDSLERSLRKWLQYIRKNESPDLIIGAFHVGLNPFRDDVSSKLSRLSPANGAKAAIRAVKGLDLALLGHDHTLNPRKTRSRIIYIEKTPIISGGRWGEALLSVILHLQESGKSWRIKKIEKKVIKASQDVAVEMSYRQGLPVEYKKYISTPLPYKITRTSRLNAEDCLNQLTAMANDSSSIDGSILPKIRIYKMSRYIGKTLTRRLLFHWLPYANKGVRVQMSGREIALLIRNNQQVLADGTVRFKSVYPLVKGRVKIDNEGSWWLNLRNFEDKYTILVSDYHYHGGGGVLSQLFMNREEKAVYSTGIIRDRLFQFLAVQQDNLPKDCSFLKPL